MNAKLYAIIGVLVSCLIASSTYAIRSYMESPKARAERINLELLKDCLDNAREVSVLEEALQATRDCSKTQMIQVIEPSTSTGTVTPASSGVPGGSPRIYPSEITHEQNTLGLSREGISSSGSLILTSRKTEGKGLEDSDDSRSEIPDRPTIGQNGGDGEKRKIETIPILSILNLDSCRITQDEDSHVTQKRGHVYAYDIACEKGKSFTVSAPNWKESYTVKAVGEDKRMGNYIVLEHKNYMFVFAHTESPHKVGDIIPAGTQIGYTDASGIAENVHLHFELWRDGYNITHEEMLGKGSRWNDEYSFKLLLQRGWYTGIDDSIDLIASFEGFGDTSYEDPKGSGRWSIGYGTYASGPGEKITREQAKIRIRSKVIENMDFIYRNRLAYSWNERIALSSFFYNLGTGRPEMIQAIKKGDKVALEKLWKAYIMKGSIYEDGLTKRRAKEWSKFISK